MKTIPRLAVLTAAIIVFSGALIAAYFTDFALVVGSFKSERNAEKFVGKLKQKGYETRIIRSRTSRGAMSRVIVGKFTTVREALVFKENNLTDKLYKGVWVINMLDTSQLALVDPKSYIPGTQPKIEVKPAITTTTLKDTQAQPTTSPTVKVDPKSITHKSSETKNGKSEPKKNGKSNKTAADKIAVDKKAPKSAQTAKSIQQDSAKPIKVVKPEKSNTPIKVRESAGVASAKQVKEETIARTESPKKGQEVSGTKPAAKTIDSIITPSQKQASTPVPQQTKAIPDKKSEIKSAPKQKKEEKPVIAQNKSDNAPVTAAPKPSADTLKKKDAKPAVAEPAAEMPVKRYKNKTASKSDPKTKESKPIAQSSSIKKSDPKLFESFTEAYQKFIKAAAESDAREISQFIHLKNGVFVYINPGGGRVTLRTDSYQNVISIAGATISFGEKAAKTAFSGPYNRELKQDALPLPDCSTLKYKRTGLFASEIAGTECNLTQNYKASKETVNYKLPANELEQIQDAERTIRFGVRSTESSTISTLYFSYIAGRWYLTLVDFTSPCLK